ncbi:hypothetical protein L7F22_027417 [Adiantum nelumboides]|nr:hypothetical protein [Adiantum nelumboides]
MALNMAVNRQLSEQPDDSDFEFEHSDDYSNEPPPSPKLHNFSPSWQRGMVSTTHACQAEHIYTAAPIFQHFHVMDALHHGGVLDSDTILQSPDRYSYDATHDISHNISTTEELGDSMLYAAVMSISPDQREKERPNLRSLMLKSKNLEQLPSLSPLIKAPVLLTDRKLIKRLSEAAHPVHPRMLPHPPLHLSHSLRPLRHHLSTRKGRAEDGLY